MKWIAQKYGRYDSADNRTHFFLQQQQQYTLFSVVDSANMRCKLADSHIKDSEPVRESRPFEGTGRKPSFSY